MPVRNSLKHVVKGAFAAFGADIRRTSSRPRRNYGLDDFFPLLNRLGFRPKHIVDVGANHGNWTRTAIRYFPSAAYTLVEPQAHLKEHIQDLINQGYKITWISVGCSDVPGELSLMLSHRDDSSTFVVTDSYGKSTGSHSIIVPVTTLNQIASSSTGLPDVVKIDAEGFDLKVLAGASDLIGKTEIFLIEAGICSKHYDNSIMNVMGRMEQMGYDLMDITDLNRSPKSGVLWLSELAFVRKQSQLLKGTTAYE